MSKKTTGRSGQPYIGPADTALLLVKDKDALFHFGRNFHFLIVNQISVLHDQKAKVRFCEYFIKTNLPLEDEEGKRSLEWL